MSEKSISELTEELNDAKELLIRWCNGCMSMDEVHNLERETLVFCAKNIHLKDKKTSNPL
jgi:hypothetical protein